MTRLGRAREVVPEPSAGAFPRLRPMADARRHVPGGPPVGAPPGVILEALRQGAGLLREEIRASGRPSGVTTRPLLTQPHPTADGLFRAARTPAPWLWLTERMVVVTWRDVQGTNRTLLWCPSDHERDSGAAAVRRLRDRLPVPARFLMQLHGTPVNQLQALGVDPADIDFVCFPHLQTQDLRRVLGTVVSDPKLIRDGPEGGWFPNARLLVQRAEWETLRHTHPLQSPWYQSDSFAALDRRRIELLDGDHLIAPGVALISTPGHTMGNQSLVLHTSEGVQVASANGVLPESWAPGASRIPGLRRYTLETGLEVIPRARTLEFASWQYASMVGEAALADRTPDARFPLILPVGELAPHRLAPGLQPTFRKHAIEHGRVLPSHAGTGHAGASRVRVQLMTQVSARPAVTKDASAR
jgi:hypothetical protein